MKKILVTGAHGQLGSELQMIASRYPFQFFFTDAKNLDITRKDQIQHFFESKGSLDYCINTAAFTAVDLAESDKLKAFEVNVSGVSKLASVCAEHGTTLLHISTDFVFDGTRPMAYPEESPTSPLGIYGTTKAQGEREALRNNPKTIVLRTAWLYSEYGSNFVNTMLRLAEERETVKVVDDQIGSPTYAADLAEAIMSMINVIEGPLGGNSETDSEAFRGIFNYTNEGVASWYDFAQAVFELVNAEIELIPVKSAAMRREATRPHFSVLDKSKIKEQFGLRIPHWRESLKRFLGA